MRFPQASFLSVALLATGAHAQLLLPDTQLRQVSYRVEGRDDISGLVVDTDEVTTQDPAPFAEQFTSLVKLNGALGHASGMTESVIGEDRVTARGSLTTLGEVYELGGYGLGSATLFHRMNFGVSESVDYTLRGALARSGDFGGVFFVRFAGFDNVSLPSSTPQVDIEESGSLEPGFTYSLEIRWSSVAETTFLGSRSQATSFDVELVLRPATPSFCNLYDDALSACPCSNAGAPDTGCDIQQSTGGVGLVLVQRTAEAENRVTWQGTGFPSDTNPAAILIRSASLDPQRPVPFGDGLRCVGTPLVRIGAAFANDGVSTHVHGHASSAGSGEFYYQLWFRNTPATFCTPDAFNLSSGKVVSW